MSRLAIALFVALLALSCARPSEDEIAIGAYLSFTGADSTFGADTRMGIDLAVDEANARGGVRGKRVRVVYADDKSQPAETTQKVQELVDREQVIALLGEVASSRSIIGGLLANTKHVPMITPSSTAEAVTRGRAWVFRTCFTNAQQADAAARYVVEKLGKKRVALLYGAQNTYASGNAERFAETAETLGASVVAAKAYQNGETNFTTYLREVWSAAPDAIYAPVYYNDMIAIARQAHALGIPGSAFVGGDAWDSEELLAGAGAELEGAIFTNQYASDLPGARARALRDAWVARYGHEPGSIGAQGYDAAKVLLDAIARADTLDRKGVRDAIERTRDFEGATGTMTIDASHDVSKPAVVVAVNGGRFRYVDAMRAGEEASRPVAKHLASGAEAARPSPAVGSALLTGLAQGAMIALVALGYTMVFGVLRLINFAHSEVFMTAAYVGLFAITAVGGVAHPVLAAAVGTVLAMIAAALLGVTIDRLAYAPIRRRAPKSRLARTAPLVTALAVSVLLQNIAQLAFSARFRSYPQLFAGTRPLIVGVALVTMAALELFVRRTWTGKAMRAVASNPEAARLLGIAPSRVFVAAFAIGSSLAAVGAVLYCLDQSQVYPTMGFKIGTQAFVAAVLGGIGKIPGAMLGGLLLGVAAEMVKLTDYSGGVDVLVFAVLVVVLLVRPSGLLGSNVVEKV